MSLSAIVRSLFCRHEFVERGTFKRGNWWSVLECEKCHAVKREKMLPTPVLYGYDGPTRKTELTIDELREYLRSPDETR